MRTTAVGRWGGAVLTLVTAVGASAHAEDAPTWLQAAAATVAPSYGADVHTVVLLDEGKTTIAGDGKVTREWRYAIRILSRDGAKDAVALIPYDTDISKVRDLKAWHIPPSGAVKRYGKSDVLDVALVDNDVYNESRARILSAAADVVSGSVFGYESVVETQKFFHEDVWSFQHWAPVLTSSYVLTLPPGWRAEGVLANHADVVPRIEGASYVWELRDLKPIEREKAAPPISSLTPRLNVRYFPPEGTPRLGGESFKDWDAVARWATDLVEPQSAATEALSAKARELTRDTKGEWQQLSAIARFVQSVNYISIQIGVGRYRPHAASEVLAKLYGDCKDKANLMVALLKVMGIRAYLVLVYSSDPSYVRPEWPSPRQFNHAIVAIQLRAPDAQAAVLKHDKLGALLFFDPTDPHTPLGDLPEDEQGGWGLLAAGTAGGLVRLPELPPAANRIERHLDVTLGGAGSVDVSVNETSWGQSGVQERDVFTGTAGAYTKRIERWLAASTAGVQVAEIRPTDRMSEGRFDLAVRYSAPSYSQLMQNRMLVFCPVFLSRRDSVSLTEPKRVHPINIASTEYSETARITLPAGFAVDELPDPVAIEAPFGSYALKVEASADHLNVTREMHLKRFLAPATEYAPVRAFFGKVAAAERSSVVLARR